MIPLTYANEYDIEIKNTMYSDSVSNSWVIFTGVSIEIAAKYGFNIVSQNLSTAGKLCHIEFKLKKK